ncbi:MAG: hypothetical protein ACTSW1_10875 [Candidatus Hodarchaeales archaeon]
MGKSKRRTDYQILGDITKFILNAKGLVTLKDLCNEVGINTKTAQKWMKIIQIAKTQCPNFQYQVTEKESYVIRPYFDGPEEEIQIRLHRLLAEYGIEVSELRKEIVDRLSSKIEKTGLIERHKVATALPEDVMIELKKEIAEVVGEKVEGVVVKRQAPIEATIAPDSLQELKEELVQAIQQGRKGLTPVKEKKPKEKLPRSEFHDELLEALVKGIEGLKPVDPKEISPQDRPHVLASLKQELLEVISKRVDTMIEDD